MNRLAWDSIRCQHDEGLIDLPGYPTQFHFRATKELGVKTLARNLRKHNTGVRSHPGFRSIKRDIEALF